MFANVAVAVSCCLLACGCATLPRSAGTGIANPVPSDRAEPTQRQAERPTEAALRAALTAAAADLASNLLSQGRANEALTLLDPLTRTSNDPRALRILGVALDLNGRQPDAQAAYRRGLASAPSDANLLGNLALSLAISGQIDEALGTLQTAAAGPDSPDRVLLLAMAGRDDQAREAAGNLRYAEAELLLSRGHKARDAATPADRAAALGVVSAAGP